MYEPPLVYMWMVYYEDGRVLPQFDLFTGEENLYKEALGYPSKIVKIGLYSISFRLSLLTKCSTFPKLLPNIEIHIPDDCEIIILRRNYIRYKLIDITDQDRKIVYMLGWKKGEHHSIMFIDEEGNIELSDNFELK